MRLALFLIFILAGVFSFSQVPALQKLWGSEFIYIKADSEVIRFETFHKDFGSVRTGKRYCLTGDTLRLHDKDAHQTTVYYDFLMDTSKKDELTLIPVETNSKLLTNYITLAGVKQKLTFREIHRAYTDTIKFERILFRSTNCYGRCPAMTFEIDNKKQLRFIGQKFAIKEGYFVSTLSNQLYNELFEILKISELDKLKSNNYTNVDLPTFTLEIHYNNKVRYLRSCVLPFVTDQLTEYLLTLPAKIELTKAKEKFDIQLIND